MLVLRVKTVRAAQVLQNKIKKKKLKILLHINKVKPLIHVTLFIEIRPVNGGKQKSI